MCGVIEAQRPLIVRHGIVVGILVGDGHVAQGLVTPERNVGALSVAGALSTADEGLVHQVLCLVVLAFLQQPLDLGQRLQGQGVAVVARCPRPQGDVVQRDGLLFHPAVGHHAEVAVAQGEALLPYQRGGGVGEVPLRLRGLLLAACDEEQGDDEMEEAVHGIHPSMLVSFVMATEITLFRYIVISKNSSYRPSSVAIGV